MGNQLGGEGYKYVPPSVAGLDPADTIAFTTLSSLLENRPSGLQRPSLVAAMLDVISDTFRRLIPRRLPREIYVESSIWGQLNESILQGRHAFARGDSIAYEIATSSAHGALHKARLLQIGDILYSKDGRIVDFAIKPELEGSITYSVDGEGNAIFRRTTSG